MPEPLGVQQHSSQTKGTEMKEADKSLSLFWHGRDIPIPLVLRSLSSEQLEIESLIFWEIGTEVSLELQREGEARAWIRTRVEHHDPEIPSMRLRIVESSTRAATLLESSED